MTHVFKKSEIINLPIDMVWKFASDPRNTPGWLFDITEIKSSSPQWKDQRESTWLAKTKAGGKANNTKLKIIRFEEQYRFEIFSKSRNIQRLYSYSFSQSNNVTQINLDAQSEPISKLARLCQWANALPFLAEDRKQLSRLKQLMMQLRT